jgi:hypothetical protein
LKLLNAEIPTPRVVAAERTLTHLDRLLLRVKMQAAAGQPPSLTQVERATLLLLRLPPEEREAGEHIAAKIPRQRWQCGYAWAHDPELTPARQRAFGTRYERIRQLEETRRVNDANPIPRQGGGLTDSKNVSRALPHPFANKSLPAHHPLSLYAHMSLSRTNLDFHK